MVKAAEIYTRARWCLCKIIIPTIAILAIINPSYSTTVTGSGNECKESVLNTDTGPANLRAEWTANTINLEWYNGETKITPSNNTANTCTYDSSITLPSNEPTKTGYTFGGWRVCNKIDLATLNANQNASVCTTRNIHGNYCWGYDATNWQEISGCDNSIFDNVGNGEWKAVFDYGTVIGISKCSSTQGNTFAEIADISNEAGQYCWCSATGFVDKNTNSFMPSINSAWGYVFDNVQTNWCEEHCTRRCGDYFRSNSSIRAALYGISQ